MVGKHFARLAVRQSTTTPPRSAKGAPSAASESDSVSDRRSGALFCMCDYTFLSVISAFLHVRRRVI
jgi:hypothetical protein